MIKKLVRHGNSRALVIDKPVLDLLGLGEDAEFEISTDGTSLLITPLRQYDAGRNVTFDLAAEEATVRYGSVFRKLAR
jgi:antitoxin component of MazEF toxin-antitoxin module